MTVFASVTATLPTGTDAFVTAYEDTDSDGAAETSETVILKDGVVDCQFPSLAGDSASDYWFDFDLRTDDTSATPEIDAVTVDPNPADGNVTASSGATLNSHLISATVYEDTDADGAANNQITTAVPDGTTSWELLNLAGGSTNDFWVDVVIHTDDTSTTPTLGELSINPVEFIDGGSITTATASSQAPAEIATLTDAGSRVLGTAVPLTSGDSATLTDVAGRLSATAAVQTAPDIVRDEISGTVTLNGSGVEGAKIYIIDTDADAVEATATTDANGDYSVIVPGEPAYHVAVQYDDGADQYNALSKPYIN